MNGSREFAPIVVTPELPVEALPRGARAAVNAWLARVSRGDEPFCDLAGSGEVEQFSAQFGEYVGAQYAVAAPSATLALLSLLRAIEVGPGDEVIVSTYGWGSTVAPVLMLGATPVFADIDPDNLGLRATDVENRITPNTAAILATHMCGIRADVARLEQLASENLLPLIFDAAQALGAQPAARQHGACGDASVFSFGHRKLLSLGEGGMVVTNHRHLYMELVRGTQHPLCTLPLAIEYGLPDSFDEVSLSSRMHGAVAAMGSALLPDVDRRMESRRLACKRLTKRLKGLPGFRVNGASQIDANSFHTFALTVVPEELNNHSRDSIAAALRAVGVPIVKGPVLTPLHRRHRFAAVPQFATSDGPGDNALPTAEQRCARQELVLESESRWSRVPSARIAELGDAFEHVAESLLRRSPQPTERLAN